MKLSRSISNPKSARSAAGFTMVEIAIALAVIAFALIAIIGILPTTLQTNRDVREDTIVNQDARVLVEAIKGGSRDLFSDIGSYVVAIDNDGIDYTTLNPPGISTSNLVQLLTDPISGHTITLSAISGAVATRGNDLGFRYQVTNTVVPVPEYDNTPLSNQVHEVRLRFTWPVLANNRVTAQANRHVVRTLVSGTYKDGFLYAQHYWNADYTNAP